MRTSPAGVATRPCSPRTEISKPSERMNVRVRAAAERDDAVAELVRQPAAVFIVDVDDGGLPRAVDLIEEDPLRGEVVLEVFVKVEVVLREVREDGRGEMDAVRPLQRQRVRRHFHHRVAHAGVDHLREPLLQHDGIGRGAIGHEALVAGAVFDRADEADRLAGGVEDRLDHLRRRRFPRGAGDADERELVRGTAVEIRGDERERGAGVVDLAPMPRSTRRRSPRRLCGSRRR